MKNMKTINEERESSIESLAPTPVGIRASAALLNRIATQLYDPEQILQKLHAKTHHVQQAREHPFVAPQTATEIKLVELWRKTLHLEEISVNDNFFEIGGNSLLAVQLMFYVRETFQIELPLNQLLDVPTIANLVTLIEAETKPSSATHEMCPQTDNSELAVFKSAAKVPYQQSKKPLIYLLSTPRAGSTLLRVMLMGHSQIFAPPELHLLPFDTLQQRAETLIKHNKEFLKIGLIETIQLLEELSSTQAFDKMQALEAQNISIQEIYQWLQQQAGDRYLVDKSPSYAIDTAVLERAEHLSEAPFYLFLVRHPLAVMESFVRNSFDKLLDIQQDPWRYAEDLWVKYNTNLLAFLANIPPHRQLLVQYEKLVQAPEAVMKTLCSKLGVDFEAAMLTPYEGNRMTSGLFEGTLSCGDPNFTQHKTIDATLAQTWKQHRDKLDQLHPHTLKIAQILGYSVEASVSATQEYSLAPAQMNFMNTFGTDPIWHVVQHLQLKDADFKLERFEQSLQKLIDKHGVLRNSFLKKDDQWIQREHENVAIIVGYEDLIVCDDNTTQQRVLAIEQAMNDQLSIQTAPLLACTVVAIKPSQYTIIMVVHHLVADGVTLAMLHRELFDLYQHPEKSHQTKAPTYASYVKDMKQLEKSGLLKEHLTFWQSQIQTMDRVCPTDYPTGANSIASQEEYETVHEWSDVGVTPSMANSHLFDAIAVALYQYVATWTHHKRPVIVHRLHRRNMDLKQQYTEVAGWFAGDIPLSLNVEQSVSDQILSFQQQMRACPMGGVTYEILSNQALLPKAHEVGSIRLNYQPTSLMPLSKDVALQSHLFESATHDRLYLLDIIIRTNKTHFKVIVRYSKHIHDHQSIEKLVKQWLLIMKGIIGGPTNQQVKKGSLSIAERVNTYSKSMKIFFHQGTKFSGKF